jgi:hypothetical protein
VVVVVVVVIGDEGIEQACSSTRVLGWTGWAASQCLRVRWKRSTLPQVVGWLGLAFWTTPRHRGSVSSPLRAPLGRTGGW